MDHLGLRDAPSWVLFQKYKTRNSRAGPKSVLSSPLVGVQCTILGPLLCKWQVAEMGGKKHSALTQERTDEFSLGRFLERGKALDSEPGFWFSCSQVVSG